MPTTLVRLSPSSRRAWIEISQSPPPISRVTVALLAEGVDRNIKTYGIAEEKHYVALLAEGVDRNPVIQTVAFHAAGSPSSRRAWIEITIQRLVALMAGSPSSRRAWIEICWP